MAISLPGRPGSFPKTFRSVSAVRPRLREACAESEAATFHPLGTSEEGRPIDGIVLGEGPQAVSLIAGNHADEPVGPATLRTLVLEACRQPGAWKALLERFRFCIVPHTNPDGEARNRTWMDRWPDPKAYLLHAAREKPGRDLEFGFPAMREENRLVSGFLRERAPTGGFSLHMSLHGMALAEGAQLLIERRWTFRTQPLRDAFAAAARQEGLGMHDHNRKGEKGFFYIEPGFTTTPEGAAMRVYFRARGEEEMAARFHDSSMEWVRSLGGDPLCLVTELPLFVLEAGEEAPPGVPRAYLRFKERLPELKHRAEKGKPVEEDLRAAGLRPLPLPGAMRLQRRAIELGLEAVAEDMS